MNELKPLKCEICGKEIRYSDGVIMEGTVELGNQCFCSEKCYKKWRAKYESL